MELFFKGVIASLVYIITAMVAVSPNDVYASKRSGEVVTVSYYGGGGPNECGENRPCHGSETACGQVFNMYEDSVAHKTLPCGTKVKVCEGSKCLIVKVEDRGPYVDGRTYDLSYGAAKKLGILKPGTAKVLVTIIK